jgi:hypothetical protein
MAVEFALSLDVQLLDSMLLNILGGSEGDDISSLLAPISKRVALDKIDDNVVSKRVKFIAHKPRQPGGTQICTSLDGNTYAADDPDIPAIPQHFGCRSHYQFIGGALSGR